MRSAKPREVGGERAATRGEKVFFRTSVAPTPPAGRMRRGAGQLDGVAAEADPAIQLAWRIDSG
jgi:hypothetical protein